MYINILYLCLLIHGADIAVGRLPGKVACIKVAAWSVPNGSYALKSIELKMADIERIANPDICLSDVDITERVNQLLLIMGVNEGDRRVFIPDTNFYNTLSQHCKGGGANGVMSMAATWHRRVHPLEYACWAFFVHVQGVEHWSLAILLRPGTTNAELYHLDTMPGFAGHNAAEIAGFATSYMRALQRRDYPGTPSNASVTKW
jgi:hypothetical protein